MSEFVEMDIFFFITTMVVIVVGVLLAFVLLRIWRILGHVEEISKDVSEESALVRGDIAQLRGKVHSGGLRIAYLKAFFTHALKRIAGKRRKASHHAESEKAED